MNPIRTLPRNPLLLVSLTAALAACGGDPDADALESRPDTLAFAATSVGEVSQPRLVEWTYEGADSVAILDLGLEGAAAGDFVVDQDLCAGRTLPPGGSCTAIVLFGPREAGARAAAIAPRTAVGTGRAVALRGEGTAPADKAAEPPALVRAVPETLDFGEQPVGAPTGPLGVRLVNQRPGAVQFAARVGGGQASDFRIALDRCSNEVVDSGRACTIRLLFEPTGEGRRSAELVLRDLNGPETQVVPLVGTGVVAGEGEESGTAVSLPLAVRPRDVEFGVLPVGAASPPRLVRVENTGARNVGISLLRIAGGGAEAFRITADDCQRRGLVPTRGCAIEIVFQPPTAGTHAARLEAVTPDGVEPALVLLSGTGEAPGTAADAPAVDVPVAETPPR